MSDQKFLDPVVICSFKDLEQLKPTHARVENTDLVVIRDHSNVHVMYGRCLHRGAILADGYIKGKRSCLWIAQLGLQL